MDKRKDGRKKRRTKMYKMAKERKNKWEDDSGK